MRPSKNRIAICLFLLGAVELFYGVLWGRVRTYAHEAPFARALRLQELSAGQQQAFNHYIDLFQNQWLLVAVFGVLTVLMAAMLWRAERRKS